jgi:glycosyltransferase involved in cell wall biosynthesis
MRICALVKYPPIQGGVSAQCFWLMRGLADAGHEVFVVTNAPEIEDAYRIQMSEEDRAWLEHAPGSGGRVRLARLEPFSLKYTHIPQSRLFVSRLSSVAADVVRRHGCDLLFGYYFEPYAVAAHLASSWTGVPYVVQHAGSDLGRLMNQPDLATAYREITTRADGICTMSTYSFLGLGVRPEALYRAPEFYLPREHFHPGAEPLDLAAHIAELVRDRPGSIKNHRPFDPALPTIGIYGKLGLAKGSFDLVAALGSLRKQGLRFNFAAMTRGTLLDEYHQALSQHGIDDVTWVLPFIPHWKIPGFIRSCDAVCFLERDFPVRGHAPRIPTEILACGTCLILSGEIAKKQDYAGELSPGESYLLAPDPRDHASLASALRRVIEAPSQAAEIGRRGAEIVAKGPDHRSVVGQYEAIFQDTLRRRSGAPSAIPPEQRGVPASRDAALRRGAAAVWKELGEAAADGVLAAYLEAHPEGPENLLDDAMAFCRHFQELARRGALPPGILDTARYAELLVWQSRWTDEDARQRVFDGEDALPTEGSWAAGADRMARLAPLRSNWMRIARFQSLPPHLSSADDEAPEKGERVVVFHKLPNLRSHHFGMNRWSAELLERCDGARTTEQILSEYRARAGRPEPDLPSKLLGALRRFYREGMIIFVAPGKRDGG